MVSRPSHTYGGDRCPSGRADAFGEVEICEMTEATDVATEWACDATCVPDMLAITIACWYWDKVKDAFFDAIDATLDELANAFAKSIPARLTKL